MAVFSEKWSVTVEQRHDDAGGKRDGSCSLGQCAAAYIRAYYIATGGGGAIFHPPVHLCLIVGRTLLYIFK